MANMGPGSRCCVLPAGAASCSSSGSSAPEVQQQGLEGHAWQPRETQEGPVPPHPPAGIPVVPASSGTGPVMETHLGVGGERCARWPGRAHASAWRAQHHGVGLASCHCCQPTGHRTVRASMRTLARVAQAAPCRPPGHVVAVTAHSPSQAALPSPVPTLPLPSGACSVWGAPPSRRRTAWLDLLSVVAGAEVSKGQAA